MRQTLILKAVLLIAGGTATALGTMILFMPHAFYAGYQIDPGTDPNLLNEMKSPTLALIGAGLFILSGIIVPRLTRPAIITATALYLSYGLSRLISTALDGPPSPALLTATATELLIGLVCLFALWRYRTTTSVSSA